MNAWPLDEGLIDYVKQDIYDHEEGNKFANANIIADKDKIDAELLKAATDLLVADLQTVTDSWADGKNNYRKAFLALDEKEALRRMLFGMWAA
jgi:uncharacterized iron-regulated protein